MVFRSGRKIIDFETELGAPIYGNPQSFIKSESAGFNPPRIMNQNTYGS